MEASTYLPRFERQGGMPLKTRHPTRKPKIKSKKVVKRKATLLVFAKKAGQQPLKC
jgi:hypothetical protein